MSKLRVYMVAKELGLDNKSLVSLLHSLGVTEVRNHMSAVGTDQIERVKRHLSKSSDDKGSDQRVTTAKAGSGSVIIRRGPRKGPSSAPVSRREPESEAAPMVVRRSAAKPAPTPRAPEPRPATVARAPEPSAPEPAAEVPPSAPAPARTAESAPPESLPTAAPQPAQPVPEPSASAEPATAPPPAAPAVEGSNPAPVVAPEPEVVRAAAPEPERDVAPVPPAAKAEPRRAPAPKPAPAPARPKAQPSTAPTQSPAAASNAAAADSNAAAAQTQKQRTGIDVWQGRPGVPMPKPPRAGIAPRRVQYDAKVGGGGPRRGPMAGGRRGPGPRRGIGSMRGRPGGSGAPVTQERAAHKKVVKIEGSISLQALAGKLGIKAGELLMKLMSLGMTGININSTLDSETAKIVGDELGWTVSDVAVSDDEAIALAQGDVEEEDVDRTPRAPVVTVMGHVDHGKTSLLDRIRKASVAGSEAGGITQHIGAYSVKTSKGRMAFLDTPGHAAFTAMRARGAQCTDIVVLVVAADDGVMPQTKEAINHAKSARCPIVVAVNKIDKEDAQPERVRRELSELGLQPEEWGGETLFCEVSAQTGEGIDQLLDAILLQGEMLDLRANPKRPGLGTVIEAKLDRGRGPVATILVTDGTLRKGDGLLVGNAYGRVRAMLDENGRSLSEAGPATPVAVIGLNEVPSAGDAVNSVPDAKKAQQIAEGRRSKERSQMSANAKISMEELARRMSQSDQKELKLIVKGDVQGSVEALHSALEDLSTDKVRVNTVHSGVGAVTEGDVNLAVAAGAIILGFNVRPAGKASSLAQREGIEIRQYGVIYDALDDVRATMEGLLTPKLVEEAIGEAEVRKIFKVSKAGVVAGCMVIAGVVRRNSLVKLRRGKDTVWEGTLNSLKRFKDDAKEVREGFDCGISFQGYNDLQEGDVIAAFEMKEVRPTL